MNEAMRSDTFVCPSSVMRLAILRFDSFDSMIDLLVRRKFYLHSSYCFLHVIVFVGPASNLSILVLFI